MVLGNRRVDVGNPQAAAGQSALKGGEKLTPGQSIERALNAGETHVYEVALKANQYMHILVDQRETDVNLVLLDPGGKELSNMNWEAAGHSESLWAMAEVAGNYQLKIVGVTAKGLDRRYIVKLDKVAEFETADARDQMYVQAYRLFWQASELGDQNNDQAFHQAAEKYEAALRLWRSLNDVPAEAFTLHELGYVYGELGEHQKGIETYEQALRRWQATKNHEENEAVTLHNMALAKNSQGQLSGGLANLRQELELWRVLGDPKGQALALSNIGTAYYAQADFQAMIDSYQKALPLARAAGDPRAQALILSSLSAAYFGQGEFQQALNYCRQALPLRRAAGDRRGEAFTLTNIGSNYRELGEPQKALGYYLQALSLVQGNKDLEGESPILDAVGRGYYDLGDYPKSLEYHQQALASVQRTGNRYGEGAAIANIGSVYARMGDREKALTYFEQSLELRRALGDRRGIALTLQNAGELYRESGDRQKALTYFNEALEISRAIKNRFFEANLLYGIARIEQSENRLAAARPHIEAAIAIIESTRTKVASADLRVAFLASKQEFYEFEIDLLMQSYERDRSEESLVKAFSVSEQRRARSLLDTLGEAHANIRQGVSAEVLARERALRARLDQKAESQIKLLSGNHSREQADALTKEVEAINADYEQVLADIRTSSPHYAALTQSAPVSLREIQTQLVDSNTLLIEYSLGKSKSYVWTVTSTGIAGYVLPGRSEIESQARRVYELLTSRNRFIKFERADERKARIANADAEYFQAAEGISQILLKPLAANIQGKRLVIVSDGALQYLPFGALPSPETTAAQASGKGQGTIERYRPLIADHEVTCLPSASILSVLRREVSGRKPAPKTAAVLADPVFSRTDERVTSASLVRDATAGITRGSKPLEADEENTNSELVRAVEDVESGDELKIPRLPFTRQEAQSILRLIPRAEQFAALDFEANRLAVTTGDLSKFRIVHFATHGLLNTTHPALSGLILSLVDQQGNDQDGFLATHEILNLNLPADLVVLSGCRTGLGKEIRGEGMVGLTRAFMYAGAARVAVSLWDVNDKSTAELMTGLYSGMLGKKHLSPAAALREAQIRMWNSMRWKQPYYWAAFVLQGEYR